jgi:alpha-galactosidase
MSSRLKIAVLGAGSLALTPGAFYDALVEHRLDGVDFALADHDEDALYPMADLGRRMAAKHRSDARFLPDTDRQAALDGAAYVIVTDAAAPPEPDTGDAPADRAGVAHLVRSLRHVAHVRGVCDDVKRLARPGAMLLVATDCLARACQAAHDAGVPAVGFGGAALTAYKLAWEILHDERVDPPFDVPRERLNLSTAGVDGLSFVLDLWDHETGEDLYPRLRDLARKGRDAGHPLAGALLRDTGFLPATGDDRLREFVPPPAAPAEPPPPPPRRSLWWRAPKPAPASDPVARRARALETLRAAALGQQPWDPLITRRGPERPVDLVAALAFDRRATFPALNLVNHRQLPHLPRGAFVETAATADKSGIRTPAVDLPPSTLPLLQRAAHLAQAVVRAAGWRSTDLLHEAIDLDSTIPDKAAARATLEAILTNHPHFLPRAA